MKSTENVHGENKNLVSRIKFKDYFENLFWQQMEFVVNSTLNYFSSKGCKTGISGPKEKKRCGRGGKGAEVKKRLAFNMKGKL